MAHLIESKDPGWRFEVTSPSLPEIHRSLATPVSSASFLRKLLAFAGPGFLVAVGYMDPGNWATDLAGGSKYNYTLLSVIMLSNLMAILLQALAIKLGVVTGRDLAQACRDHYATPTVWFSGSVAKSRLPPVIWRKSLVPRLPCNCCLAYRSFGDVSLPRRTCWRSSFCKARDFVTSKPS